MNGDELDGRNKLCQGGEKRAEGKIEAKRK
jgi:hypothetical protein